MKSVEQHQAVEPHAAIGQFLHFRLVRPKHVGHFAHQFFHDVLQGHQARRAAVFVEQNGDVLLALPKAREQIIHPDGVGHEQRLAHQLAERRLPIGRQAHGRHQILHVQNADDVIEIIFVDGIFVVMMLRREVAHFPDRRVHIQRDHFGARHHHLMRRHLAKVEDGVDHLAFFRFEHAAFFTGVHQHLQLFDRMQVLLARWRD